MHTEQITHHKAYARAFALYMRRGVPIDLAAIALEVKADTAQSPYYIGRTSGDDKVRPSHAANNGKIFAWDNPPPTGNPGEEFGCRCTAEPYDLPNIDKAQQNVISVVDEGLNRWGTSDFLSHFYFGGGATVTLSQMRHLQDVINLAKNNIYPRFENQIINKVRLQSESDFSEDFVRSYEFYNVSFWHGRSTVSGIFNGNVQYFEDKLVVSGTIKYSFRDEFTDPLDIRQLFYGTSSPKFFDAATVMNTDLRGKRFYITDNWTTSVQITRLK